MPPNKRAKTTDEHLNNSPFPTPFQTQTHAKGQKFYSIIDIAIDKVYNLHGNRHKKKYIIKIT